MTEYISITKEEFINKYGDFVVEFSSYYKYKFYFTTSGLNYTLEMVYGGSSDKIYYFDVSATDTYAVKNVDWSSGRYLDMINNVCYEFSE